MFFQIYGDFSGYQLLGWLCVFAGLIICNEIARRSKAGGIFFFLILPLILTVYFIAIAICAANGADWALKNETYMYMNGWFHYAKLYAATAGCIGFMMLKYGWGIGKKEAFKVFPFLIVAINIFIAVGSDFESAIKGAAGVDGWWFSNEGVWLNGGWWNWANGIAGIINVFCMTGWWGIYSSKKKDDMLWPDMTWKFIVAYDIWNFAYTYNNLPTHTWYCGLTLLLAPTFAAHFWNKGGWIQNRANTLAIWCMFAQVFPVFQIGTKFAVLPSLYEGAAELGITALDLTKVTDITTTGITANPTAQGLISMLALVVNVICLCDILKTAKKKGINPYKNEIWKGTPDFEEAMDRA